MLGLLCRNFPLVGTRRGHNSATIPRTGSGQSIVINNGGLKLDELSFAPSSLVLKPEETEILAELFFRRRFFRAGVSCWGFDRNDMRSIATGRYVRLAREQWSARPIGWTGFVAPSPTVKEQYRAQSTGTKPLL